MRLNGVTIAHQWRFDSSEWRCCWPRWPRRVAQARANPATPRDLLTAPKGSRRPVAICGRRSPGSPPRRPRVQRSRAPQRLWAQVVAKRLIAASREAVAAIAKSHEAFAALNPPVGLMRALDRAVEDYDRLEVTLNRSYPRDSTTGLRLGSSLRGGRIRHRQGMPASGRSTAAARHPGKRGMSLHTPAAEALAAGGCGGGRRAPGGTPRRRVWLLDHERAAVVRDLPGDVGDPDEHAVDALVDLDDPAEAGARGGAVRLSGSCRRRGRRGRRRCAGRRPARRSRPG